MPELRYYQEEAVQSLFDYFNDPVRAHSTEPANPLLALPTGTGKSVIIAEFIRRALTMYPGTRIMMSTHVKELIRQNAERLRQLWPTVPLGVYSAGLNSRDCHYPVIFGGVQSMVKKFPLFGRRDLLIIDEAHLLAEEGSYIKLIEELKHGPADTDPKSSNINPYLKVIGLTATPYRLGLGLMTNGKIFTDIVYNLCTMEGFNRLIAEGYLCTLIPKRTHTALDTSNVGKVAGDFNQNQLEEAVDKETVTFAALSELVEYGHNRKSWLIFASGVRHANHIFEMLNNYFGIPTGLVHSSTKEYKRTDAENQADFEAWKAGKLRAIVNMNSLTTGVDHPPCDLIGMLRPTMSTGLWVQMLGRGTRPYPGKDNCLVLDFARNTRRLGPINDPLIPKQKGNGPPGDAPVRICDHCGSYNHASARVCFVCGEPFPIKEKIHGEAGTEELLRSDMPQIERFPVSHVAYTSHLSKKGNNSIKVAYFCGIRSFYEWVSVESPVPLVRHKAREWFRQRYHYKYGNAPHWDQDVPKTNNEVLTMQHELRQPVAIQVWVNRENPQVQSYEW